MITKRLFAILLSFLLISAPLSAQDQDKDKKKKPKDDVEQIGNRDVDCGLNFYGLEKEVALGKQFAQEIERSVKLVDDPVVNEYVNRVGQRLVRNSDAKVPFTIKVIESDQLNAFALPGGFFYVNSGLILAATEEAEMAGVMAHEIAHVTARHGTCNATKGQIAQLAMIPLMIFGPGGWAGYGLYQGLNFFIPLQFLAFSRGAERQADYLGLQYMYKTGYDPNSYIAFFEKIQAQEKKRPGSIPKIFSSHPPSGERIQSAQTTIATILPTRDEYIVSTSEFDLVKQRLFQIQSVSKAQEDDPNRPTLRKRTEREEAKKDKDTKTDDKDDDRPVLKRRPN
ncbi:MAG: M48 family metallopeptidase [Candidatus Acidiferrales bacterium]